MNDNGLSIETFAVVITLVAPFLHSYAERMPVIVAPLDQDRLLQALGDREQPLDLLQPLHRKDNAEWQIRHGFKS